MTIAEVSKITGISSYTLRYYEKEGLLRDINRTNSGVRSYSENDIETLSVIACLKMSGLSIKGIKEFIDLCVSGDSTLCKRLDLLVEQKKNIEKQKNEIDKHMNKINKKIEYYKNKINGISGECQ